MHGASHSGCPHRVLNVQPSLLSYTGSRRQRDNVAVVSAEELTNKFFVHRWRREGAGGGLLVILPSPPLADICSRGLERIHDSSREPQLAISLIYL